MAGAEILAAGGIVVRGVRKPLIAIVQRRKDDRWFLPKGKLKRREKAIAAARREVIEETGHDVEVHEFLGAISYEVRGKAKLVEFWRMQAVGSATHELADDIKAVEWLPLQTAIGRLDHPLEQVFLRNVGRRALERVAPAPRAVPSAVAPPSVEPDIVVPDGVEPEAVEPDLVAPDVTAPVAVTPEAATPVLLVADPSVAPPPFAETTERPHLLQRILQRLWRAPRERLASGYR
jgi:8-oxo-dGTP diphosphatase